MKIQSFLLYALIICSFAFGVNDIEAQTVSQFDIDITGITQTIDVRFGNGIGFTTGLNPGYDAGYALTDVPTNPEDDVLGGTTGIYTLLVDDTLNQGVGFMIQTLPYAEIGDMEIPLGVNIAADGSETITINNITAFPAGHRIIIEDRNLGTFNELQGVGDSYAASLTAAEPEKGRFFLHTTNDVVAPAGPGSMTTSNSLNNDIDADIMGSCGADAPNGNVLVTTTPANGFTNQYNTSIRLDANGDFTVADPNWSEGVYTLSFSCRDKVGNGLTVMGPFGSIEIDVSAPATPATPDLQAGSDTGLTNADDQTSSNTPTFNAQCTESDSTITLHADGVSVGTHTCTTMGTTSVGVSPTIIDGTYEFTLKETDLAGNESAESTALEVVIDTTIDPIIINIPTAASPLSGNADANSNINISTPSGSVCTAVADNTGQYSCTLSPSPIDGEDITATATDIFGNTISNTEIGGIDVNAPVTPVMDPINSQDTVITGTGEDATTITLDIAVCVNAPVVVTGGIWSCTISDNDAPQNGDSIVATSTDVAGNFSTGIYRIPEPKRKTGSTRKTKTELSAIFDREITSTKENVEEGVVIAEATVDENTSTCFINYSRLIRQGMRGEDVRHVQACISSLGYPTGPIDGIYGRLTYAGIRSYQEKNNLMLDGIIGPQTAGHLNKLSSVELDGKTKINLKN